MNFWRYLSLHIFQKHIFAAARMRYIFVTRCAVNKALFSFGHRLTMLFFTVFIPLVIVCNNLLHFLGCYLLWKTYNWTTITTQQLIIFNLSLCESLDCCFWFIFYSLLFAGYEINSEQMGYLFCVHLGSAELLYMLMMALTFDRLMNIVIGMRYQSIWTVGKTRKLLITFWVIGMVYLIVSVVLCYHLSATWFRNKVMVYIVSAKSVAFIIVSIGTYNVLFWKYKKSRDSIRQFTISGDTDKNEHTSALQMFRNSRFYVSVLMILTYLLFHTIPYCVLTFLIENSYLSMKNHVTAESSIAGFMLHLGYASDAVIYIFLQTNVRKTLSKMVCRCRDNEGENLHRLNIQDLNLESSSGVWDAASTLIKDIGKKTNGGDSNWKEDTDYILLNVWRFNNIYAIKTINF